jgi:MFS transporter, NNP family, nitrate/nitrite transporter
MHLRDFRHAGHWPTLVSAFLYFDISFMVWVLLGALANAIVPDFGLSAAERGFMVAVPLLGGAVLRLPLGLLTDRIGARRTGMMGLTITILPLLLGWLWADSFTQLLLVGLLLGVAGIAGAGNSGTALATFFGPRLAEVIGWHAVFGLALIPILITLAVFILLAKDSPQQPAPRSLAEYASVLRQRDTWWFCLFYAVTFGGFVGLASFLSIYFHDHYELSRVQAGTLATLCVIAGSFLRPVGGYLSDRLGGVRVLTLLYLGVGVLMLDMATSPPLVWGTIVMVTIMGLLGLGNGSVFQLVPQRFAKEIGVITGIVGAAGGFGGFFLPTLMGSMKELSGSFGGGFLIFALIALATAAVLVNVSQAWEGVFVAKGGVAAVQPENA